MVIWVISLDIDFNKGILYMYVIKLYFGVKKLI